MLVKQTLSILIYDTFVCLFFLFARSNLGRIPADIKIQKNSDIKFSSWRFGRLKRAKRRPGDSGAVTSKQERQHEIVFIVVSFASVSQC